MKSIITRSALLLALVVAVSAMLTSCGTFSGGKLSEFEKTLSQFFTPELRSEVAAMGDKVLLLGEITGQINPKQAELARTLGGLVLKQDGSVDPLAIAWGQAVNNALKRGQITEAQALQLTSTGVVPVTATATAPPQGQPEPNPPVRP